MDHNKMMVVPFKKINNLIVVDAEINHQRGQFILDSGCPKVVLNSKYILEHDNPLKEALKGANGEISGVGSMKIERIKFSEIKMEDIEALTMDLSHLEKELQEDFRLDGLIGYEMIKEYDILYDYSSNIIVLIEPDYFKEYKKEYLSKYHLQAIEFDFLGHIPVFKAFMNEKEYFFGLDCGAQANLIDIELLDELENVVKKEEEAVLHGADKIENKIIKGTIYKTQVGNIEFKNMTTVFSSMAHLNADETIKMNGLMGAELLSKQKTVIRHKEKEILFIIDNIGGI